MTRAEAAADQLIGTCDSGTELLEELSQEELEEFDQLAFCCDTCGWWYEISEMSDEADEVCRTCGDED